MKRWPQNPESLLLLHFFLTRPHQPTLMASWGVLYNQVTKGEKTSDLKMILHHIQTLPENGQLQHYSPFLGQSR